MQVRCDRNNYYKILCYIMMQVFLIQQVALAEVISHKTTIQTETLAPQTAIIRNAIKQAFAQSRDLSVVDSEIAQSAVAQGREAADLPLQTLTVQKEKRVVIPSRLSTDNSDADEVIKTIKKIRADLKRKYGGQAIVHVIGDGPHYLIMSMAEKSGRFRIFHDTHLHQWKISEEKVAEFDAWLKGQLSYIEANLQDREGLDLEVIEESRVNIPNSLNSDSVSVKEAARVIKEVTEDLQNQINRGDKEISIRGHGDTKFLLMLAAKDTGKFGIRQDNHLSDRWNGTFWRIDSEKTGQLIDWLSVQSAVVEGQEVADVLLIEQAIVALQTLRVQQEKRLANKKESIHLINQAI